MPLLGFLWPILCCDTRCSSSPLQSFLSIGLSCCAEPAAAKWGNNWILKQFFLSFHLLFLLARFVYALSSIEFGLLNDGGGLNVFKKEKKIML